MSELRPAAAALQRAPIRVLLLEDSRFDAELLREALRQHVPGASLRWVQDGAGFVQALADGPYDLILSDHELPGYSGGEALDHARAVTPRTPFIFVSGVIGEDNAVELLKRGAVDYVSKSRMARLPLVVDRALREVAERDARERAEGQARQDAEALRVAKEEAERANRAKDRFLAVLSHELRTPLAPLASAAHVLQQCAVVPEQFSHLLPMIQRNVTLEARLIEDLLDLTAISADKISIKKVPTDMHRLLQDVVEMVRESARAQQLDVVVELQAMRSVVLGDEARLQQVLWNVVRNAIKFTGPGGRVVLRTHSDDRSLTVACIDTGIGIDAAALPRIFTAFEQADAEVSARYGGLGLGLAIAKGLVRHHAGDLTAHSDGRGRGARFDVRLPLAPPDAAATPDTLAPAVDAAGGRPCRVLLVEDNADAAEAMSLSLALYGYVVTQAPSLRDALAAAGRDNFDIVVTDLGLPDGSGIDVGRQLGERWPVIALSGYGMAQDVARSRSAGFAAHLVKPVDPDAVHLTLQRVLQERAR
jgi:signal transduction histidine kinase